jgi:hypothetical protein
MKGNELLSENLKKKKPLFVLAVIQKTRILQCFSLGLEGFFQDLEFGFFRIWTGLFGFGFQTRPWFLFGLDRLFLSDWIYQKYIGQPIVESEGTLDFIVSLRIVYLHCPHK